MDLERDKKVLVECKEVLQIAQLFFRIVKYPDDLQVPCFLTKQPAVFGVNLIILQI